MQVGLLSVFAQEQAYIVSVSGAVIGVLPPHEIESSNCMCLAEKSSILFTTEDIGAPVTLAMSDIMLYSSLSTRM